MQVTKRENVIEKERRERNRVTDRQIVTDGRTDGDNNNIYLPNGGRAGRQTPIKPGSTKIGQHQGA